MKLAHATALFLDVNFDAESHVFKSVHPGPSGLKMIHSKWDNAVRNREVLNARFCLHYSRYKNYCLYNFQVGFFI